ncbi:hypothetical protein EDD25_0041 [Cryobacterium psychrophilum]|nr:hypothetical protein EDD25_0041 [Cryobacterium psychrophilum]
MTWKILSVAASAAMSLLGLFIGITSSDAGSIRYGYVIAIIGGIGTLLYSVQFVHARRRARNKNPEDYWRRRRRLTPLYGTAAQGCPV